MPELKPVPRQAESHLSLMHYRRLGQTELRISVMGFGASPLGGVFGSSDAGEGAKAVHFAIDAGVNFFDVSPYYGHTLAEDRLGQALKGRRDRVILSTKCGRYGVDQFDYSSQRVRTSVEESLKRLRTDHLDLLLIHDVEFSDTEQIIDETLPAIRRIQEEGKTRYIGISGYPLRVLKDIAKKARVDAVLSYCRYNLLIDDMDTVLVPTAEELGIGVINASPLHMGLLTEQGAPDWHPAPTEVRAAVKAALAFCRERDIDLSELALRFCFDYPRVTSTLVGMSTTEEVRRNLSALGAAADPELLREVKAILAPAANVVWSSGRPENQ
ncbi:L-fuco-beta-pyranose dehydrogenase [Acidisarcina polymorpha]|uniref:L-fuco-beta-pyranose dehydrogenase n=1 Tax=Acidisarcina polymorpha TaxID=2211140 RepID=A0A2Z5G2H0_9BACT|nr:aldo/keto reductase [Acidisarcina polymorpha]AXC13302.1 L-fuco-beta-pyranose dehydrogenase [Acidisarcina polymorpha]